MTHAEETTELLNRPEPAFSEGWRWPRTGWLGWVLWGSGLLLLLGALLGASVTDMVVKVPVTGMVTVGPPARLQFVITGGDSALKIGLPVRIQRGQTRSWAVVEASLGKHDDTGRAYVHATARMIDSVEHVPFVDGQACPARVLVGKTRMLKGLWKLATNQGLTPDQVNVLELQGQLPEKIRDRARSILSEQRRESGS